MHHVHIANIDERIRASDAGELCTFDHSARAKTLQHQARSRKVPQEVTGGEITAYNSDYARVYRRNAMFSQPRRLEIFPSYTYTPHARRREKRMAGRSRRRPDRVHPSLPRTHIPYSPRS
eukprot:4779002-Pyramimonas_sp.AAC.1